MSLIVWMKDQFENNEISGGVIMAGVVTSLLYSLKTFGLRVTSFIMKIIFVSVEVKSTDRLFKGVEFWVAKQPYTKRVCRKLRLKSDKEREIDFDDYYPDENRDPDYKPELTAGDGKHVFFYKRRLIVVNRSTRDRGGGYGKEMEHFQIKALCVTRRVINNILDEIEREVNTSDHIQILCYEGSWRRFSKRRARLPDTVFFNGDEMDRLTEDIKWFSENEAWYAERGIPYRRGYLFSGPPGTGKTSLVSVLAGMFGKNVGILDMGSCEGDSDLLSAVNSVLPNTVTLIEDIDAIEDKGTKSRSEDEGSKLVVRGGRPRQIKKDSSGITLSGLLNALDGVAYPEGSITVMTTNYPERLDEALIRTGRVNLHLSLEKANEDCARRMFCSFYKDVEGVEDLAEQFLKTVEFPVAQSDLQEMFTQYCDNPVGLIKEMK